MTLGSERWIRIDTTPESTEGEVNSSPTWGHPRVLANGIDLQPGKQTVALEQAANLTTQDAPILDGFTPALTLNVVPSPYDSSAEFGTDTSFFRFLMDWMFVRSGGSLNTHTVEVVHNGVITQQLVGCKPQSLTISYDGSRLGVSVELWGLHYGRLGTALVTGGAGTFPSKKDWLVRNTVAQIGGDFDSGDTTASDTTVSAFSSTFSNNMTRGPLTRWYPSNGDPQETLRVGPSELQEGELNCTGNCTFRQTNDDEHDHMLESGSTTRGSIRILGFHPDSVSKSANEGSDFTTSSGADITVDVETGGGSSFTADKDFVYLEDHVTNNAPGSFVSEVLGVKTILTNTLTLETTGDNVNGLPSTGRGQSFDATDTVLFVDGFELHLPKLALEITDSADAGTQVETQMNFVGELASGDSQPLRYKIR